MMLYFLCNFAFIVKLKCASYLLILSFPTDDMGELLLAESKLELYLKENPLKPGASPSGPRPKLIEVRKHLNAALDRGNLKVLSALKEVH